MYNMGVSVPEMKYNPKEKEKITNQLSATRKAIEGIKKLAQDQNVELSMELSKTVIDFQPPIHGLMSRSLPLVRPVLEGEQKALWRAVELAFESLGSCNHLIHLFYKLTAVQQNINGRCDGASRASFTFKSATGDIKLVFIVPVCAPPEYKIGIEELLYTEGTSKEDMNTVFKQVFYNLVCIDFFFLMTRKKSLEKHLEDMAKMFPKDFK